MAPCSMEARQPHTDVTVFGVHCGFPPMSLARCVHFPCQLMPMQAVLEARSAACCAIGFIRVPTGLR
eukprot:3276033-Lingulodinium_polyedra.AAC.1